MSRGEEEPPILRPSEPNMQYTAAFEPGAAATQ